ncbi:MAG: ABC transporter ATP-binding protein [Bacillota bacterium]|nr:ABC transporter ATP-binding protein [Bacillota bacterium]
MVEATKVAKRYGKLQALAGISFCVRRGECVGLVGPNGAGKSTLLRCLLGLVRYQGAISLFGQEAKAAGHRSLALVGAIVEGSSFFPYLTAEQNLGIYLWKRLPQAVLREHIRDTMRMVGLNPRPGQKVCTYSAGMKQRLALARALVNGPELLLLDEPTNSLDPVAADEIRRLLLHLNSSQGVTIVISSHALFELERLCHRAIVLDQGQLVTEIALQRSGKGLVRLRVGDMARVEEMLSGDYALRRLDDCLLVECGEDHKVGMMIELMVREGIPVYEVARNAFEDIYLDLFRQRNRAARGHPE